MAPGDEDAAPPDILRPLMPLDWSPTLCVCFKCVLRGSGEKSGGVYGYYVVVDVASPKTENDELLPVTPPPTPPLPHTTRTESIN